MEKRVFLDKKNKATFTCPECGKSIKKDLPQCKDVGSSVRVKCKCPCGKNYTSILERRFFFRKEVCLPGFYGREGENGKKPMAVRDLSRSGLKIDIEEKNELNIGDYIIVNFRLDNPSKTMIRRKVIVKTISGQSAGVEFLSRDPDNPVDKAYELAIGYYTFQI